MSSLHDTITLHTYQCVDGLWRTRCTEHKAAASGPYAAVAGVADTQRRARRSECYDCLYEYRMKGQQHHD